MRTSQVQYPAMSAGSAGRWLQFAALVCLMFVAGRVFVNQVAAMPGYFADPLVTLPDALYLVALQLTRDLVQAVLIPGFAFIFLLGGRYAAGQVFSTRSTWLIAGFGWTLIAAFVTGVIIRPNLWSLLSGERSAMPVMLYDPYFVMGGIGILIVIMARAMLDAVRLKEENESFI
jgi:Protein of unknown function (DUF2975)